MQGGGIEQADRAADIIDGVLFGRRHGFACRLVGREMDKTAESPLKNRVDFVGIADIAFNECGLCKQVLPGSGRKVVENRHVIILVKKGADHMAANISGSADNEDFHKLSFVLIFFLQCFEERRAEFGR